MFDHRARGHLAQAQAMQMAALNEALERGGEHRLVASLGIDAVGAGKRYSVGAQDRDAAG